MQNPELKRQSKGRAVSEKEAAFAAALERIYETGCHDFADVVARLNDHRVPRLSGESGPWTVAILEAELRAINAAHDAAFADAGIGA